MKTEPAVRSACTSCKKRRYGQPGQHCNEPQQHYPRKGYRWILLAGLWGREWTLEKA